MKYEKEKCMHTWYGVESFTENSPCNDFGLKLGTQDIEVRNGRMR